MRSSRIPRPLFQTEIVDLGPFRGCWGYAVAPDGQRFLILTRRPQGYFITHVEGAQRPTVNGQPIGTAPHALKDHDLVEIAGIKMEFFHKN